MMEKAKTERKSYAAIFFHLKIMKEIPSAFSNWCIPNL